MNVTEESIAMSPLSQHLLGSECRRQRARDRRMQRQSARNLMEDQCWSDIHPQSVDDCSSTGNSPLPPRSSRKSGIAACTEAKPLSSRPEPYYDYLTANRKLYILASEEHRKMLFDLIVQESITEEGVNDK